MVFGVALAVRTSEEQLTSEGVTASFRQLLPEVVFAGVIATTTLYTHACPTAQLTAQDVMRSVRA